jgi:hypothetical protein
MLPLAIVLPARELWAMSWSLPGAKPGALLFLSIRASAACISAFENELLRPGFIETCSGGYAVVPDISTRLFIAVDVSRVNSPGAMRRLPLLDDVSFWPFATFRGGAAIRSLSERSGHLRRSGRSGAFRGIPVVDRMKRVRDQVCTSRRNDRPTGSACIREA